MKPFVIGGTVAAAAETARRLRSGWLVVGEFEPADAMSHLRGHEVLTVALHLADSEQVRLLELFLMHAVQANSILWTDKQAYTGVPA